MPTEKSADGATWTVNRFSSSNNGGFMFEAWDRTRQAPDNYKYFMAVDGVPRTVHERDNVQGVGEVFNWTDEAALRAAVRAYGQPPEDW